MLRATSSGVAEPAGVNATRASLRRLGTRPRVGTERMTTPSEADS